MVLTYPLRLGCGYVRADRVVVLDDCFTVEPVWFRAAPVVELVKHFTDVLCIIIAARASGHGLEIMHTLFRAPVCSTEAEDG